ncbi:UNVERIFIED_CONTAM: hypothetical protein GTU68_040721 [Idotea baltica]|nr:hypothetical protein [Idotea baltica]
MPKALPDALLEGLAWDAQERRYADLSGVRSYSARVASAVGAMMCVLMRVRDADALARACDLGVAMQLTNISRDIGEDARAGRIYLPLNWFDEAGLNVQDFLNNPQPDPAIKRMTSRLLAEAHRLYLRSEAGVPALPRGSRMGIYAARFIYDGIGKQVRRSGLDSITQRAHTSKAQKVGWMGQAILRSGLSMVTPRSPVLHARPLDEVAFLVDAASRQGRPVGRTAALLNVLAQLQQREAEIEHRSSHA